MIAQVFFQVGFSYQSIKLIQIFLFQRTEHVNKLIDSIDLLPVEGTHHFFELVKFFVGYRVLRKK